MASWMSKKYIDERYIELFEKNKGKKLIAFGAGTMLITLPQLLPEGINIDYFVDTYYEKWQQDRYVVKHPDAILEEEKGTYMVFITSQHSVVIKQQLEKYGLEEGKDFINLYGLYEMVFRYAKQDYQRERMHNYIETISQDFPPAGSASDKKIGVVLTCTSLSAPVYDTALYLVLRKKGYDVELIVDDCYSNENKTISEGISSDVKEVMDELLEKVKNRFEGCVIKYISDCEPAELDIDDLKEVQRATHANAIWMRSRLSEKIKEKSEQEWYDITFPIYEEMLKRIKGFFQNNRYNVINIFTGLHGQRYFYPVVGKKYGMRVSTYDGSGEGTTWTSSGSASHRIDICRVIKEGWLNAEQKKKVIEAGKIDFNKRINATGEAGQLVTNYQSAKREKVTENYFDIVLPLNVMWDAAALARNTMFDTEFDWVVETLNYILEHTEATVLVREHPAARVLACSNEDTFGPRLKKMFEHEERIYIADYDSPINTYEYVEHCKLVLPHTSTIGVESALMGKTVVLYAEVYYDTLDFVKKAKTKEEYFDMIREAVSSEKEYVLSEKAMEEAWIAYYLGMDYNLKTYFKEQKEDWMQYPFEEILNEESVNMICELIVDAVPVCYRNAEKL